jgi:hypothetical protein
MSPSAVNFCFSVVLYLIMLVVLLVLGYGTSCLVAWLVPGIDAGHGFLGGLIAAIAALHFTVRGKSLVDQSEMLEDLGKYEILEEALNQAHISPRGDSWEPKKPRRRTRKVKQHPDAT